MAQGIKIVPIKFHDKKQYVFHVIGTDAVLRYDVMRHEFQIIIAGVITQRINWDMTFAKFEIECKYQFGKIVEKSFGLN
jgi:hypothetical protein